MSVDESWAWLGSREAPHGPAQEEQGGQPSGSAHSGSRQVLYLFPLWGGSRAALLRSAAGQLAGPTLLCRLRHTGQVGGDRTCRQSKIKSIMVRDTEKTCGGQTHIYVVGVGGRHRINS